MQRCSQKLSAHFSQKDYYLAKLPTQSYWSTLNTYRDNNEVDYKEWVQEEAEVHRGEERQELAITQQPHSNYIAIT